MSRSEPTPQNPAKKYFKWSGSTGDLSYYDKEQKKEIAMDIPFEFMVLDQLATVTGFCEPDESSYWSNEIRSVAKEPFTVKTSKGVKEVGLYKDLTEVRSQGAKYAKSVYIAYKEDGVWVIGNLKAAGAALSAWITLSNTVAIMNGKVRLTGSEDGKKGRVTFKIPVFEWDHTDTDEDEIAIELDKELQIYLKQYFSTTPEEVHPEDDSFAVTEAESARLKAAKKDVVITDIGEEEVDLNDVPDFGDIPDEEPLPPPPDFLAPDKEDGKEKK